jgi:DinB family protein
MHAKDVIRENLDMSEFIVTSYLGDLSDVDLMLRPVEGMNHIAWQVGHLISSERQFIEGIKPGSCPALPAEFETLYTKEGTRVDDGTKFRTKAEYLDLWKAQRAATKAALDTIPDSKLDEPAPEQFRQFAPTVGSVLSMVGTHTLMHVGQWVGVRRKLKKPISI